MQSSPVLEQSPPGIGVGDGFTDAASNTKAEATGNKTSTREAATGGEAPLLPGAQSLEDSPRQSPKPRLVDMLEGEKQFLMHSNVGEQRGPAADKLLVNLRVIADYRRREADQQELNTRLEYANRQSADLSVKNSARLSLGNAAEVTTLHTDRPHYGGRKKIAAVPSKAGSTGQSSASAERYRAFTHRQRYASGSHDYNRPECSYVMQASRDRRTQTMIKDYGLIAANSNRQAPFFEDKDDHRLRLKRVPFRQAQALGMHVNLSGIASPGESRHTSWMLRQREKHKQVAEAQNRRKKQQLEQHFKVSSPATQLSRAIDIDEKTRNARATALMKQNPMLCRDFEAMKTWNTT